MTGIEALCSDCGAIIASDQVGVCSACRTRIASIEIPSTVTDLSATVVIDRGTVSASVLAPEVPGRFPKKG